MVEIVNERPFGSVAGLIGRSIETACAALAMLGGFIFIVEAAMSVVSVIGRSLFSLPIPGDYELVQMTSAMGVAMCLPYCQLRKGHVFVDVFTLWAPEVLKRLLDAVVALLLAGCSFVLAWRSWVGMLEMHEYGETSMVIGLPVWWGYIPVASSFVLLGIAALLTLVREISGEEQS